MIGIMHDYRWELNVDTYSQTVDGAWDSYGRTEGRIEAPKGTGTSQEDQQGQLSWPLALSVSEPPPKDYTLGEPRPPCTYVTKVQLVVLVGPEQVEQELSKKLLSICGIYSSNCSALPGLNGKVPSSTETWCARVWGYVCGAPTQRRRCERKGEGLCEGVTERKLVRKM